MKNARSLALICALATFFKRCDIKKCGNIPLEKIPKFLDREQKGFMAKFQRTTPIKKVIQSTMLFTIPNLNIFNLD